MKRVWRILRAPFRLVAWLGHRCLNLASKITGVEFAHGEMDGAGYEHYVAQYLYKNGYKKVIQTGKTGDMGVDLEIYFSLLVKEMIILWHLRQSIKMKTLEKSICSKIRLNFWMEFITRI